MYIVRHTADIAFPNLGIYLDHVGTGVTVFGFWIAFYGIIIALGMILGYFVAAWQAKRTGQEADLYLDLALVAIPICIAAARLYYVMFQWDMFRDDPLRILNIRQGGLGIYGGVIAAIITAWAFSKRRKVKMGLLMDTACVGLLTGQIVGRWGNFFNREAFGGYAGNSLFAMELPWDVAKLHMSADSVIELEPFVANGAILVHPTFLYESLWNLCLLLFILVYTKHKKFDGELILFYMAGYGAGRFWIESLRTDQLLLWGTGIPVSMVVAAIMVFVGGFGILWNRNREKKKAEEPLGR